MKALIGLEFGEVMARNADAIKSFVKDMKANMTSAKFENLRDMVEHLRNSVDMVNPFSSHYKDVEWEGLRKAIGDVKVELKEATDAGVSFGKQTGRAIKELWQNTKVLRQAITLLSVALVPIAGVMSSFSASALGKEVYNTAQRVGMSTAKYQQWKYIIEQTGGDMTDLIGAQQTLTEAQLDVANGAEDIIKAFNRIGLSAKEVMAMDRQELFEKTIAGLQNIENSTERAAIAYKLLSEDGSTLAALLARSNEETRQMADNYAQLGAIMSEELIVKSVQFQGALANLRGAFTGLTNTLAELFLPILTTVINGLTWLIAVANMAIRTLFGLELTTSSSGTSSAVGSGINGFNTMTGEIEGADKAAKQLRRTLMGFDELNVLEGTKETAGGASGAGASGIGDIGGGGLSNVGGGLFSPENLDLGGVKAFFDKWGDLIRDLVPIAMIGVGAVGAVLCLMGGNWVGALGFATMAGIGFAAASAEGGLWDKLRGQIEKLNLELPLIILTGIAAVGALYCFLTGNIIGGVALATIAGIGVGVIRSGEGWSGLIENIKQKLTPLQGIIIGVLTVIASFIMGGPVLKALKLGWGLISAFFTKFIAPKLSGKFFTNLLKAIPSTFSSVFGTVRTVVMNGWNHIADYFRKNIADKFSSLYWQKKFNPIKSELSVKMGEAKTAVINGWNHIKKYFVENIATKFSTSYWSGKFDVIRAGLSTKLGEAKTVIQKAWENIKKYFKSNIGISFTPTFWAGKFGTIKEGARQALNGVIDVVERAVNAIISKLNTLSWSIPEWIPKVGGKKFGFNIKQVRIPRLAEGGIATASTLANIGENGREAVLPLDHNTEWMDALADKIASRSQGPTKLVLKVGEKELGWASIKGINQITRQTGELQLVL
jgi:hypothetical protein